MATGREGAAHLRDLILADFEYIRACQEAIGRAGPGLRPELAALMADHEERARALAAELVASNERPPTARDVQGKAAALLSRAASERDILAGLLAAEEQLYAAFREAAAHGRLPGHLGRLAVINEAHMSWLKGRLGRREGR
jgi:myo-inositol catabolism protein IolC